MRPTSVSTTGLRGFRNAPCWAWAIASPHFFGSPAMIALPRTANASPERASVSDALRATVSASAALPWASSAHASWTLPALDAGLSATALRAAASASAARPAARSASACAAWAAALLASAWIAFSAVATAAAPCCARA